MSFEIEHTLLSPEQRLEQGNVVLGRELFSRDNIEQLAWECIENREVIDELPLESELYDNSATALFERIRAAGHLTHLEFNGDQHEIHLATLKRLLNGYSEDNPEWEKARNFQELCEEITVYLGFQMVESGELPEDTVMLTISDFPDDPVDNTAKVDMGYRALNHKGMLRSHSFLRNEDGGWTRVLEQVSRSNSHDTSTRDWFNQNAAAVPITTTGGLSEQVFTSSRRMPDGIVTLARELDGIYGTDRLYGESNKEMHTNQRPSYDQLREESAEKERLLQGYIEEIHQLDAQLKVLHKTGKLTYKQRLFKFHDKIKWDIIPRILLLAPEFARDAYGEEAAPIVEKASLALNIGDSEQAYMFLYKAFMLRNKDADPACGGMGINTESDIDDPFATSQFMKKAVENAVKDKESWDWREGKCVVPVCPTKPNKTKVGPCSVCEGCQKVFDKGEDPTKMSEERLKIKHSMKGA